MVLLFLLGWKFLAVLTVVNTDTTVILVPLPLEEVGLIQKQMPH